MTFHIQCLCGDVKLEVSGEPMVHAYCHCDNCQTAQSAPYVKVAIYPVDAVKVVKGKPISWNVVDNPRYKCPRCGTVLFQQPPNFPVKGVNAYLLPEGMFQPAFHQQCQYSVIPVKDNLPHFKGYPASMGGVDDLVGW